MSTAGMHRIATLLLIALGGILLAGCGGGGSGGGSGSSGGSSSSGGSTSSGGGSSSGGSSSGGTLGSASLSWAAPTTNADGSNLTDLAGFHVYYGNQANLLNVEVDVNDRNATSYVVGNLAAGTWYFAVAAVNAAGLESDLSNTASKTIN